MSAPSRRPQLPLSPYPATGGISGNGASSMSVASEGGSIRLADIAGLLGVQPPRSTADRRVESAASLDVAEAWQISYMDGPRHTHLLRNTRAGICLVPPRFASLVPPDTAALVVENPRSAYARLLGWLHPEALKPGLAFPVEGIDETCRIHPTAVIEPGVALDPGVIVGSRAVIGAGTTIGAHSVIGPNVVIGRDCAVSTGVTLTNCRIGERVLLHAGVRIGQDGFGFFAEAEGHRKFPQIGGVIIGDDVEIGANTTVDRGSGHDTLIGAGTKIDNLVQIAHNVRIGRHCIIVAQVGIGGSTVLDDYVVVGGQAAIADHLHIGRGASLAAASGVMRDVPAGERWGGSPAKPTREWLREQAVLARMSAFGSRRRSSRLRGLFPAESWFEAFRRRLRFEA
ncbi:UDP-3-O-(3-hydroxymyristoyl)glucosamine N-acyltransferase [Ancylobacter sp. WKF20]|uniref:UDP-3-O-(3-hydroxymyristoyl)glucosamine N-acyltransferase n=1 Tax=Ancylobacter sp. WKF20 TaxID=3039801 RepID=UPI0024341450|nr:UDP-3-O-(3-hydroxymyristoyl)glucosamine N-acyltransferase [Ancylobacter sp. WKF20]WGD32246.1 UDP-3-O-(3-hydroxymyristoyl)glucosamine N-acyltransferase [Ancylobacter sp. WKF20]